MMRSNNKKKLQWLDDGIKDIIDTFSYEIYVVHVSKAVDCSCKNFTTKQGRPDHKLCLGTGQQIKIRKIRTASQETSSSFRNTDTSESGSGMTYYVDAKYPINQNDYFVDGDNVQFIHRVERKKGTNREFIYQKCISVDKKTDVKIFLKNFYEIMKGRE